MYKLLFALDRRQDAMALRKMLLNPGKAELSGVLTRLVVAPHSYPNHLLGALVAHLPRIKASLGEGDVLKIAENLEDTIQWEIHQRDRQLMM